MNEIDISLLVILYSIFGLFVLSNVYIEIKKNKKIELNTFFELYIFLVYSIAPIVSVLFINVNDLINSYYFTEKIGYYYLLYVITVIFYLIYYFFIKLFSKKEYYTKQKKTIDISSNSFFFVNILISVIGLVSLVLWTKAYGKPWDIIKYASAIRSGYSPIVNKLTFFKPFCYFLLMGFYNSFIIFKKTKFKILNFVVLIIDFIFSVIFLFANDSRMMMLIFVMCLIFYYKNKNINISLKNILQLLIIAVGILFLLGRLDNISYYVRNGVKRPNNTNGTIAQVVHDEFTYTYRNGVNVLYLYNNNLLPSIHEFKDLKNIVFAWIPERFKQGNETLGALNTSYYVNSSGAIPTDIITASIYKFHIVGIIIMPIFIAYLICLLERMLKKVKSEYTDLIYTLCGCYLSLRLIADYDLSDNLFSCFYIIISYILFYIFSAKTEKEEGGY